MAFPGQRWLASALGTNYGLVLILWTETWCSITSPCPRFMTALVTTSSWGWRLFILWTWRISRTWLAFRLSLCLFECGWRLWYRDSSSLLLLLGGHRTRLIPAKLKNIYFIPLGLLIRYHYLICCRKKTGMEYILHEAQEPHLFVIRKQKRDGPEKVSAQAAYYVLDGSIYQAPHLYNVIGSRVVSSCHESRNQLSKRWWCRWWWWWRWWRWWRW